MKRCISRSARIGAAAVAMVVPVFLGLAAEAQDSGKVRVDLHIMSKCPYGAKMLGAIVPNFKAMKDRVDINIHYIGKSKGAKLHSMHGEEEVKGDILQLCAHEQGDLDRWLDFIACQNENQPYLPMGWEECAKKVGLDTAAMKMCSEGAAGTKLLKDSFKHSAKRRITGSPTVYVNGSAYKGARGTHAFGRMLCEKMGASAPPYCATLPQPTKMTVTIVGDKRCKTPRCDTSKFAKFVAHAFEASEVRTVDYSDPEGKQRFEASGQQYLPLALFPLEVEKETEGMQSLKRIAKLPDNSGYVVPLGNKGDSEPPRPAVPPASAVVAQVPQTPQAAAPANALAQAGQPAAPVAPAGAQATPQQPGSSCGCQTVGRSRSRLLGLLATVFD